MKCFAPLLLMLSVCLTGCYSYIEAPGAVGKVIDADTGKPVRGAIITRPWIASGMQPVPAASVSSDKTGWFNLPAALETELIFAAHSPNPEKIEGSFIVTATGYASNELHGVATSRDYWRVDLGRIPLKKPRTRD